MWIIVCIVVIICLVIIVRLRIGRKNAANTHTHDSTILTRHPLVSAGTPLIGQTPTTTKVTVNYTPILTDSIALYETSPFYSSSNIIINHSNWDCYNRQPLSVIKRVAQLKIFFVHASIGANILQGFKYLNTANASKYPLIQISSGGTPPTTTDSGTIYEYSRGNPLWSIKIKDFASCLKNGWGDNKVDLVMYKFCYIDQIADWIAYRDSMNALETQYPRIKFIYWTLPLTTRGDYNSVLRSQFNQNLRSWIAIQNNKILFDIADMEAWSPDGQVQTFMRKSMIHYKLYKEYSADGGHLNAIGMNRTATGLYSLFGEICGAFPDLTLTD